MIYTNQIIEYMKLQLLARLRPIVSFDEAYLRSLMEFEIYQTQSRDATIIKVRFPHLTYRTRQGLNIAMPELTICQIVPHQPDSDPEIYWEKEGF